MTETRTPRLDLPLIQAAQAQKHVTHNEALAQLDTLVFLALDTTETGTPPAAPSEGARHLVAAPGEGAWAGQAGTVALWRDGAWSFLVPRPGWLACDLARGVLMLREATAWRDIAELPAAGRDNLARLGINATANAQNRLALRAPASLFAAEAGSHRMTVNKDAAGDAALVEFKTGYAARGAIGLSGTDNLSLSVSADGTTLAPALTINRTNRRVGIGTATPGAELEVADSSGDNDCRIQLRAGAEIAQIGVSTTQVFIDTTDEKPFVLYGNGSVRVFMSPAGNLGIGTSAPRSTLEVNGRVTVSVVARSVLLATAAAPAGTLCFVDLGAAQIVPAYSDGNAWRKISDDSSI